MIVLDASVLIGLLDPRDAHHADAIELLADLSDELVVHPLTLAEVLVGPTRSGHERDVMTDLASIGVQTANLGSDEPLLLAGVRVDHGLKMPDACVLATAVHYDAPLASFDTQLTAASRGLGLSRA